MITKKHFTCLFIVILYIQVPVFAQSTRHLVESISEFNEALDVASSGDSIVWKSGTYADISMDIDKNDLVVTAEESGEVIMTGSSIVEIPASNITLSGIQWLGGSIGSRNVINIDGSNILITQINIQGYTCYKYLIIDEDSRYVTVSYSNFENRLNYADQNILSILVDNTEPGYHKVQYCSFKNFPGGGNDEGVEPVRIGVSSQADFNSRSIVEYCYFSNCDGDGEIISNKSSQSVIRYNTFENNSKAELVLRHGDEAIVYGNFFINNMGGIRVREGQNHFIYNNYFTELDRRPIYLQNESSDPLDSIHIYFNTSIDNAPLELGNAGGSNEPTNVTIANNIFVNTTDDLFEAATGTEKWIGNISSGTLGITRPDGISDIDPQLEENAEGYYQLTSASPAIDAALDGFPDVPVFEGVAADYEILLDLMAQTRPSSIGMKDVGATEFSESVDVSPHVTEENTGPAYLSSQEELLSVTTSVVGRGLVSFESPSNLYSAGATVTATATIFDGVEFQGWSGDLSGTDNPITFVIQENTEITATFVDIVVEEPPLSTTEDRSPLLYPNPTSDFIKLDLEIKNSASVVLEIVSMSGQKTIISSSTALSSGNQRVQQDVSSLTPGTYFLHLKQYDLSNQLIETTVYRFLKR